MWNRTANDFTHTSNHNRAHSVNRAPTRQPEHTQWPLPPVEHHARRRLEHKVTHPGGTRRPLPPVVLYLTLPHVERLAGATGSGRPPTQPGAIDKHLVDSLLPTLLPPQQVVFAQHIPVTTRLSSPKQVLRLQVEEDVQRQLKAEQVRCSTQSGQTRSNTHE